MYLFLLISLFLSYFCYLSMDPMKSCLYLILSLIFMTPFLSLVNEVWYSYFICMVFLSGIFVILVYFTSMSKYNFYTFSFSVFIFIGLFFSPFLYLSSTLSLNEIFYASYVYFYMFLFYSLLYFMNFTSYFLNFSGALRKV